MTSGSEPAPDLGRATALEVSRATADDAETIAWLVREGFRSEAERYGVEIPPMREVAADVVAALEEGDIALVARVGENPVGTVRGHKLDDGSVMVRRLAVLPSSRREGVGRALMMVLEAEYPTAPRFEIFTGTDTAPAIALYESLGYRRTREQEQVPGVTIVFLEKRRHD